LTGGVRKYRTSADFPGQTETQVYFAHVDPEMMIRLQYIAALDILIGYTSTQQQAHKQILSLIKNEENKSYCCWKRERKKVVLSMLT